ncbi:leukotriene C4 synthase isoform X2 [Xenopus laevis]|nr:leukotriene C4 synthase isoform X2 [Xenopus laevis]
MQVIWARRKYKVSPPSTSGHPCFERVFRAQLNCSEYFSLFISVLWVSGLFFHQGTSSVFGLLYLYTRYAYFHGYAESAQGRLKPMYASATILWILIGLSTAGLLDYLLSAYFRVEILKSLGRWFL